VVCGDDILACGLIQGLRTQGLQIPAQLSVSGVDNIAEAERLGLTTIRTDRDETCRTILDILERRINDPELPPQVATISSSLILRDSEGAPRVGKLSNAIKD
jgi:LacI family transcriptional regulator